jgi:hypothetical protein
VWVSSPLPFDNFQVGVRVADDAGVMWDYRLLGPERALYRAGEWYFYAADLQSPGFGRRPESGGPARDATVRVQTFFVRVSGNPQTAERISFYFDDAQATAGDLPPEWWGTGLSNGTVIEGFESLDGFEVMTGQTSQAPGTALSRSQARVRGGTYAAQISFMRERGGQTLHGFRARDDGALLAVVVSDSFLREAKKSVGDELQLYVNRQYVMARIAGRFKLFPTYTPDDDGPHLMLADLDHLLREANGLTGFAEPGYANEVWLTDVPAASQSRADLQALGLNADRVVALSDLQAAQERDPLVAASWEGILFLSFAAVLALTALGFIVYSYLSARGRALEFAILRTMGFSGRQILTLVCFEQAFVILAGTLAGTLLGLPLGRLMIGYMGVTETGAAVLPPFVSHVSWRTVALADGLLALTFIATIAVLVLLYQRLAVHRALRMGEL